MANIRPRQKKDGSFSYQITVFVGRDSEGNKIIKSTTFVPKSNAVTKAQKEAEIYAADYERLVLSGDGVIDDSITFEEFATKVWKINWLPAKTPAVQERYLNVLKIRVFPTLGTRKLTAIRATDIDNILKGETAENRSPRTVRYTAAVINSVMRYAYKKNYIRENPFLRCDDLPPIEARSGKDLHSFTLEQADRFIHEALTKKYSFTVKGHERTVKETGKKYRVDDYTEYHEVPLQWQIYFMMAVYGGLRRGEMCGLTWNDVDDMKCRISISKAMSATKEKGQFIKGPKTRAGIRDIPLPKKCFDLLRIWKKEQRVLCMKLGTAWLGHRDYREGDIKDSFEENNIFIQMENGLPVHLSTPSHKFAEIIDWYNRSCEKEEDKLPKIRLHDLRHTTASLLLSRNINIESVAKHLGHSKPSVTLDIYGHALPEDDQKVADTLENMFGQ